MVAILKAVFLDPENIKLLLFPVITGFVVSVVGSSLIGKRSTAADRQAWINSLRDEMSKFPHLTFNYLEEFMERKVKKESKKNEISLVCWKIKLMLNNKEDLHVELMNCMDEVAIYSIGGNPIAHRESLQRYEDLCHKVLKAEWDRAKRERNPISESKTLKCLRGIFFSFFSKKIGWISSSLIIFVLFILFFQSI